MSRLHLADSQITGIKGAVFDCDGILIDSEQPWIALMADCLDRIGAHDVPAESLRGLTAEGAVAQLAAIHRDLGSGAAADPPTTAEVDAAYSIALADLTAPMRGALDLVTAMSAAIPIAVASNGRDTDVRGLLERAQMLSHFDVVVTIDDVADGKPAPDPYLAAARRLGLEAADVVALEDSPVGAQAATRAGCTVIGVNEDPQIELGTAARIGHLGQLRFVPDARVLHLG